MTKRLVSMIALAALMAMSVLAFAGFASAKPKGHVVRPGQSIQKAITAADPGDTIAVLGASTARQWRSRRTGSRCAGSTPCLSRPRS